MTLNPSHLGRGGHRDDRRRRLFSEDLTAGTGLPRPDTTAISLPIDYFRTHKSDNYGEAEFLQTQPRLTNLIPRRLISYLLLWLTGSAAIGGLIAAYIWSPDLLRAANQRPAMTDLGNYGSLGNWFGSLLLLAASLLAIITYTIRRHKVDDYRGHYHIWAWAAACWFVMASDMAASLHQGFQQLMVSLTGTRIVGEGSVWWVVPSLLLSGSIGSRLLIDMWSSKLSSIALLSAAIAYLTALLTFYHGISLQSEVSQLLLLQGGLLGGHLLVAIAMGLHARYVLLDAEGSLPKRLPKKKAEKKQAEKKANQVARTAAKDDEAKKDPTAGGTDGADDSGNTQPDSADEGPDNEEAEDKWVAVDPPHGGAQPVLKRVTPGEAASAPPLAQKIAAAAAASSASAPDDSKLSKADRKALKKRLLDERLKREQRKAGNW